MTRSEFIKVLKYRLHIKPVMMLKCYDTPTAVQHTLCAKILVKKTITFIKMKTWNIYLEFL